jgi:hypothetical protein
VPIRSIPGADPNRGLSTIFFYTVAPKTCTSLVGSQFSLVSLFLYYRTGPHFSLFLYVSCYIFKLITPFHYTYHLPLTSLKGTSNNLFLIKRVNRSICFILGTGFGVSLDPGTPVSALPEDPGALFLYRFGSS